MKPALPRLGLGMAALGRPGYINLNRDSILGTDRPVEVMQQQADLVLDKLFALTSSPTWLDCARSYGLSEKFVGEYLRRKKIPADQVYVSSKWGYSTFFGVRRGTKWIPCLFLLFLANNFTFIFLLAAYVADWKVSLDQGEPHEVKDHSTEVCRPGVFGLCVFERFESSLDALELIPTSYFLFTLTEFPQTSRRDVGIVRRIH